MAEEQGQERTESATPRRRQKAREEGNVPRSVEVGTVAVLAAGLVSLAGLGGQMTDQAAGLLRHHFRNLHAFDLTEQSLVGYANHLASTTAGILVPFLALMVVVAMGAHLAQNGILLTVKPLAPKLDRISPLTGLKRIFSKRGLVDLAKSLVKLAIVSGIIVWAILGTPEKMLPLMTVSLLGGYGTILAEMLRMAAAGAFALGLLAILDFFFQRYDYEQQIKMTRQEVREEHKQNEGDPKIKSKVRAKQHEMSRQRMMEDVKTADVLVTNPIHFAVALKYEPTTMAAPRVVARGARLVARRIRDIAREASVPVVEDPPLARALYHTTKVGGDVPLSLYQAVAELLAFVYRQRDAAIAGGSR